MGGSRRDELDPDLEQEIREALGDDSLLGADLHVRRALPRSAVAPSLPTEDLPVEVGRFADAVVSGVGGEDVFLAFGPREQGVVPCEHFAEPPRVGERVRVWVAGRDEKEGLWTCTLRRGLQSPSGGVLAPGAVVMGTARAVNKGGLEVQVGHLTAFLPASQVALERVEDLQALVGQTFPVEVVEADPERRRLVVSRRTVLARERDERRAAAVRAIQPGDVLTGTVTRVERYGAFVDLGGVEGLLHVSQLAWKRVERPETVIQPGESVKVQVLEVSEDGHRISLGRKQLEEDPWLRLSREHPAGARLQGTVTRLAPFGAFVELAEGVEGLVHVSRLAPHPVNSPKEVVRPGQSLLVRIVEVDPVRRRISLSLLTERGDRLTDDVADDATIRETLERSREPEPTLGDLLRRALGGGSEG